MAKALDKDAPLALEALLNRPGSIVNPKRLCERVSEGTVANVRFSDLTRLVESRRIRGDHHIFKHPGIDKKLNLQPDRSGDAKAYQVRQVADAVRFEARGLI